MRDRDTVHQARDSAQDSVMTVARSLRTIFGCIAIGCAVGFASGAVVGSLAPELVHANLPRLPETADPLRIALGLGLINGLWAGLVIGLATVFVVAWYEIRKLKNH